MYKKKILFIVLLFSLFGISCKEPSKEDFLVQEDIKYFQNVLENGYVFYDDLIQKHHIKFDNEKIFKEYKKNLTKLRKDYQYNIENGINQEILLLPLWNFLVKLEPNDGHLRIETNDTFWNISNHKNLYISDFYFTKKDDIFILTKCSNEKLIGNLYTGSNENLRKTIINKSEMYMFAPIFDTSRITTATLNLNNKKYKVPVKLYEPKFSNKDLIKVMETDKTLYIRSSSFHIIQNTEQDKQFLKILDEIPQKMLNKSYLILDLRHNSGGYTFYPRELVTAIYNKRKNDNTRKEIWDFLNESDKYTVYLKSSVVAEGNYRMSKKNNQTNDVLNSIQQEIEDQKKIEKKYYVGLENIPPRELPQYFGEKINPKIIVLMDFRTASGAEKLIGYLYMMNKDNILLVGLNSAGLLASGSSIKYQLPNSKIEISLASQSFVRTPIYNYIDTFHGETKGFEPDYWTNENNLVETLIYLTGDSKIENLF